MKVKRQKQPSLWKLHETSTLQLFEDTPREKTRVATKVEADAPHDGGGDGSGANYGRIFSTAFRDTEIFNVYILLRPLVFSVR